MTAATALAESANRDSPATPSASAKGACQTVCPKSAGTTAAEVHAAVAAWDSSAATKEAATSPVSRIAGTWSAETTAAAGIAVSASTERPAPQASAPPRPPAAILSMKTTRPTAAAKRTRQGGTTRTDTYLPTMTFKGAAAP